MCGIGPYKDKVYIDFNEFENRGLFLITGPTGSGKTTIFDGITFALFGETSGNIREKTTLRSDFASDETTTYVKLSFEYKGKIYAINRNPKYLRLRKRGDGYTEEKENAYIECEDEILASGIKETTDKVKELLGIDFSQFKQIAMIAQGEFLNLLVAKSDERTKIFRNIFHTKIYDTITNLLKFEAKKLSSNLKIINDRIERSINQADLEEQLKEGYSNSEFHARLKESLTEDKKRLVDINSKINNIKKEILSITAKIENAKHDNEGIAKLGEYKEKYNILLETEREIEEKKDTVSKGERYLRVYIKQANFIKEEERLNVLKREKDKLNELVKQLKEKQQQLVIKLELLEKDLVNAKKLEEKISIISVEIIEIEEISILLKEFNEGKTKYLEAEKLKKEKQIQFDESEVLYKSSLAGILASELVDNKPCPVCGSFNHPKPSVCKEDVPDKNKIDNLKREYEEERKRADKAFETVTKTKSILERLLFKYGYNCEDKLISSEELKTLHNNKLKEKKESELIVSKVKESESIIEKERNEIVINISANIALLEEKELQIKKAEELSLQYKEEFNKTLAENEFSSLEEYEESKISKEDEKLLRNQIDNYYNNKKSFEDTIKMLKEQFNDKKILNTDEMTKKLELQENKETEVLQSKDLINGRLTLNEQLYKLITQDLKEKEINSKLYGVINDLERTAKGDNPKKLIFEQYVLSFYFDEMLQAANLRLKKMTNERYELFRVEEVESIKTKDSLEIEVMDCYTGKKRSVKTLSGGESFKAALSLALGMSDVIERSAGGIEIGTLFIDEGFGALDDESLNQAIDALTMLTKKNRLIGIISHVSELKERIDNKIIVEKTSTGSRIKK